MPQLQNLVLTDRATTPVAHTFVPRDITDGVGMVVESTGVPVGESRFSISFKRNTRLKSRMLLVVPVVQTQTINGISTPIVVREAIADVTFTFDPASTESERNNLVGMLSSALDVSKTLVNDTIVKCQGVY